MKKSRKQNVSGVKMETDEMRECRGREKDEKKKQGRKKRRKNDENRERKRKMLIAKENGREK